jgi:phosphatidylglycerophosphate synthase
MNASAPRKGAVVRWGALAVGVVLFFATLYYINFRIAFGTIRQLGVALPLALLFSGLWHLARTWAWAWCFPRPRKVGFLRLARVRLAAEAFSYLTLRGIAGEPLKVVLLTDSVDAREATAAVALERVAYIIGTTVIVGIGSILALATLPLTPVWFRVFRAFAIGAGVIAALTAIVVSGRGTYFQSALARFDRRFATRLSTGRVARFIAAVERHMLALVRDNPLRLVVLLTATVAAYACMALEAWVILRAAAPAVSFSDAVAVETFSRVASFGSAFIPANLGALEASSVAAAAAVGAAGGGAALALARRLRGLFWAGLGLAIYPRARKHPGPAAIPGRAEERSERGPLLFYLPDAQDVTISPDARLAGLPVAERIVRAALKAGYTNVLVWCPASRAGARAANRFGWLDDDLREHVTIASTDEEWLAATRSVEAPGPVTAVGAGLVVSPALLASALNIAAGTSGVTDVPAGPDWPESGVLRVAMGTAVDRERLASELHARRKRALPLPSGVDVASHRAMLAVRVTTPDDIPVAESTIRRSTYKDTDATVARFNRGISLPISIALIRTPLTANQLSVILVAIGFYSAWLFSIGHYWTGVLGGFLSLAASVLDGCDGEIARLKYQESALGCWIETVGDYSYYIAIFTGLTVGAVRQTHWQGFYYFGGLAVGGTLLTFALLIYLRTRITSGQPEKLHAVAGDRFKAEPSTWSRIVWRISFLATRSAMPYGIMAFALCYALPGIVVLAAIGSNIYWVSLALKFRHLLSEREAARPDRLRPA